MALLATSLPDGIMVKTFEDRMVSFLLIPLLKKENPFLYGEKVAP